MSKRVKASMELERLVATDVPRFDWRTLLHSTDDRPIEDVLTAEGIVALDTYFATFAASDTGQCLCCGAPQTGDMIDIALGQAKFTWGLANGEGFCADCGYPARAYHRNVGPIKFLNQLLQYHPSTLAAAQETVQAKG